MPKIKLRNPPEDVADLCDKFFFRRQPTFYLNDKLQCRNGAQRGRKDARKIFRYYFPKLNFLAVHRLIKGFREEKMLSRHFCSDVGHKVHSPKYYPEKYKIEEVMKKYKVKNLQLGE